MSLVIRIKFKSLCKFELLGALPGTSQEASGSLSWALVGVSREASREASGEASRDASQESHD